MQLVVIYLILAVAFIAGLILFMDKPDKGRVRK